MTKVPGCEVLFAVEGAGDALESKYTGAGHIYPL